MNGFLQFFTKSGEEMTETIPRRTDLEFCDTFEQLDEILSRELSDSASKLDYLFRYMCVKSVACSGIEDNIDLQYELAADVFLAGNWRLLSGR